MTSSHVPRNQQESKFVCSVGCPLYTPPMTLDEGHYKDIQPRPKNFTLDIGGNNETISVDRLKPAHLNLKHPPTEAKPKRCGQPLKSSKSHLSHQRPQPIMTKYKSQQHPAAIQMLPAGNQAFTAIPRVWKE